MRRAGWQATATAMLTTAATAALATTHGWSVHYESSATAPKATIVVSGDAGPASGTQTVALGKSKSSLTDNADIIVIGGITYLKGNAAGKPDAVLHVVYSKWGEVVRPQAPHAAGSIGPVSST